MTDKVAITVKRSKRKTASIYIERDGALTVLVPQNTTNDEVDAILKANEYRISKIQAKRVVLNEKAVKREPVNGQSYLYLGRNYYLQFSPKVKTIELKGRYLYAPAGSSKKIHSLLRSFYQERGKDFLSPRVMKYAEMVGQHIGQVSVLELKNRWASCSVKRPKVNFHWKIMMAPVSVINYLIVHEVAHFKHKRHNAEFWNTVDKMMPDCQKQITWLKQYGASLEI